MSSEYNGSNVRAMWVNQRSLLAEQVGNALRMWFGVLVAENDSGTHLTGLGSEDNDRAVLTLYNEFVEEINELEQPPFTLQRIQELAALDDFVKSQYDKESAAKYLEALVKLSRVTSTVAVFEDFDEVLDYALAEEKNDIHLEPVAWVTQ